MELPPQGQGSHMPQGTRDPFIQPLNPTLRPKANQKQTIYYVYKQIKKKKKDFEANRFKI